VLIVLRRRTETAREETPELKKQTRAGQKKEKKEKKILTTSLPEMT